MVAQGKFRQDLYYRINVMKIDTPALQEHAEDIAEIALHLLRHYSRSFRSPWPASSPTPLAVLQDYPWPGNVRELENVIQRAIILAPGNTSAPTTCPATFARRLASNEVTNAFPDGSFERHLRDYKIKLAENALRENNGNKTMAARSLSISRGYLHRLIRLAENDSMYEPAGAETAEIS